MTGPKRIKLAADTWIVLSAGMTLLVVSAAAPMVGLGGIMTAVALGVMSVLLGVGLHRRNKLALVVYYLMPIIWLVYALMDAELPRQALAMVMMPVSFFTYGITLTSLVLLAGYLSMLAIYGAVLWILYAISPRTLRDEFKI